MPDDPTIEELQRQFHELCEQYRKGPLTEEMRREIIELTKRLNEQRKGKKKE